MRPIDDGGERQTKGTTAGNMDGNQIKHEPWTGRISDTTSGLLAGIASAVCSGGMIFTIHRCAGLVASSEITFIRAVSTAIVLLPFATAKRDSFLSPAGF